MNTKEIEELKKAFNDSGKLSITDTLSLFKEAEGWVGHCEHCLEFQNKQLKADLEKNMVDVIVYREALEELYMEYVKLTNDVGNKRLLEILDKSRKKHENRGFDFK